VPHDPFKILGLHRTFDLTPDQIERAYLRLVATAHPDRGQSASPADSSDLNRARQTLLNPERRANALLECLGGPTTSKSLPDGFLVEIMEIREAVEEAVASRDPRARERWEVWAEQERQRYVHEVSAAFGALTDPPDPAMLADIKTMLNAWRYVERLIEQLDPDHDPASADFHS
jgi:molecular chaperone HscB